MMIRNEDIVDKHLVSGSTTYGVASLQDGPFASEQVDLVILVGSECFFDDGEKEKATIEHDDGWFNWEERVNNIKP